MRLYRLRNLENYEHLGKYYTDDVWVSQEIATVACVKINIANEEQFGEKRCYVEQFFTKD